MEFIKGRAREETIEVGRLGARLPKGSAAVISKNNLQAQKFQILSYKVRKYIFHFKKIT